MSAKHQITTLSKTQEHFIRIDRPFPSKVRDTDHDIALLLFAEQVDVLLSGLSRIQEGDALAVAVEDKTLQWGIKRKDTNL
jgi:hypothetical protein